MAIAKRAKETKKKKPVKKKPGTGLVGQLKSRRAARQAAGKWTLGEKLTKAGRKRATARKGAKRLKKAGVTVSAKTAAASGKVRRGAVGATVTKGGGVAYAKYKKGSKPAKSFSSAFAKACKGKGSGTTFSWDGRSYSCAKKASPKKASSVKSSASSKKSDSKTKVRPHKKITRMPI